MACERRRIASGCGLLAVAMVAGAVSWGCSSRLACGPVGRATLRSDFQQVVMGEDFACALTLNGESVCWGSDRFDVLEVPADRFVSLSAGLRHVCGLRSDGTVRCWGKASNSDISSPKGSFLMTSGGRQHHCGLRVDGGVHCWGESEFRSDAMGDAFVGVHAGNDNVCVHLKNGRVRCYGEDVPGPMSPPAKQFAKVSVGSVVACGLDGRGSVSCWGLGDDEEVWRKRERAVKALDESPGRAMRTGAVQTKVASAVRAAELSLDAALTSDLMQRAEAFGAAVGHGLVAAGAPKALGVIGARNQQLNQPPETSFEQVSVGWLFSACGITKDHQLSCWGALRPDSSCPLPSGEFKQVATGWSSACAVRVDGRIVCYGFETDGECSPPGWEPE